MAKSMLKSLGNLTRALAFASIIFVSLVSCDILKPGLGDKVDVTPPVLKINALTTDNSIPYQKGTVVLSGTVNDDRGVGSVSLQFTAADGSTVSLPATISNGQWDLSIPSGLLDSDPNYGHSLGEGEQVISIVATDSSGKTITTKQSIYIDNKAPTVLVTSPLTAGVLAADTPVQSDYIDLKGEVYDQSPITKVEVSICDVSGNPLLTKVADGTNTWTTRFVLKDPGADLSLIDKSYYKYAVTVTDKAGNVSSYYYHRTGILQKMTAGAIFPAMDEIGKADQKGIDGASGITVADLLDIQLKDAASWGRFQYDATPQIEFYYSNIVPGDTAENNLLAPGTKISGTVIPPANTGAILMTPASNFTIEIADRATHTVITTIMDTVPADESDNIKLKLVGSSVGFTVSLKNGSTDLPPAPYAMRISAKTDTGIQKTSGWEEFFVDSDAPVLTEDTITPTTLFEKSSFVLTGDASHSTDLLNIVIEQDYNGANVYSVVQTIPAPASTKNWVGWVSSALPAVASPDGLYNFRLTLSTVGGKTAKVLRSVTYDTTAPLLSVNNLSPVVGTDTVNGLVNFSVSATDANGIAEVRYWVLPSANPAPSWSTAGYSQWLVAPYSVNLDTTALPAGPQKIWVIVHDKAGNESSLNQTITVDQLTDKPVLSFINVDPSATSSGQASLNVFGSAAKILGSISDDDLVDKSLVKINIDGSGWTAISGAPANDGKIVSFSHDISALPEGLHSFQLQTSDQVTAKLGQPIVTTTSPLIYFAIDLTPPTIGAIVPASGSIQKVSFTINGSGVGSLNGILANKITIKNGAAIVATPTVTAGAWSYNVVVDTVGHTTDGSVTYTVIAEDLYGKTTSVSYSYTVDTILPIPAITNPVASSWLSGSSATANGTASDTGGTGISKVEYSLDNSTWSPATGTSNWSTDLNLSSLGEGSKNLYIKATDVAGNVGTSTVAFGVDQGPPSLSETAVNTSSTVYRSALYNLTGTVSDTDALASILVTEKKDAGATNNVLSTVLSGTSQSWTTISLPLSGSVVDGTYVYQIKVTDIAGKTATLTRTVIIDTSAPTLTIVDPQSNHWYAGSAYLIDGTSADVGPSGVALVEYSLTSNTGPWTSAYGTANWTANISLNPEGAKTLYVRATDAAGNSSAVQSVAFGSDQNPPVLTETTVGTLNTTAKTAFSFGGTASDTAGLALLHGLKVSVNGGAATDISVAGGVWTLPIAVDTVTHTNDATNNYLFTATDLGGNTTTVNRTATIDTSAPILTVTSPVSGQWTTNSTPTISGIASDGIGSGVNKVYVLVDNAANDHSADAYTSWTLATGISSWTAASSLSGEGQKKVWVKAVDTAGNVTASATTLSFGYDSAPPTLTETVNGASTQTYKAAFGLGGAASDTNALQSVNISINGGINNAATLGAGTWSYTVPVDTATHLNDGNLAIVITALDAAGKTTIVNRSAIVDTKAPTITMINPDPAGTSWLGGSSYTIKGSADDGTGGGVAQVWIKVDAAAVDHSADLYSSWTLASGSSSFTTVINPIGLGDGSKKIWVKAVDTVGNVSTTATTVLFGVDSVNPVISFTAPTPGTAYNQAFNITGTAIDANLASVGYTIDGGSSTSLGASTPWTINLTAPVVSALADGLHTVALTAVDSAGNSAANTITFQKDSTVPTVSVNTLNTNTGYTSTVVQDSTPILSGTVNDNIGLTAWNYRIEKWTDTANLAGATWTAGSTMTVVKDWAGSPYVTSGTSQAWSVDLNAVLGGSLGLPLPDGRYRILINAIDGSLPANTSATSTREFRLDRGVPTLVVTTPASQGLYMGSDISVSGTAGELNGVQTVSLKYDSSDFSSGTIYTSTLGGSPTAASWSTILPIAAVSNGSHLVWIQATSYSGKTSLQSVSINVDKNPPSVAITSATNASRVTGQLVVAGTANDNTVLSKVQYRFGLNASTWYDMPNGALYSWSYTFADVSAYANSTYAREINPTTKADEPGSNIWLMPFEVRAIDQAGNVTSVTTTSSESANRFYFMLDPLGDLPVSSIFSPSDGASLGGEINIYGNATDNTWVKSLSYQVSQDGVTWTDGAGAGSANGSSAVANIVGNPGPTLSWSVKINSDGWMSPVTGTKTIYFRIHATDSKDYGSTAGVVGTNTQISIVLNSSIPQIKNIEIDTDATPANGNETAYSSGVKASGVFYVRAEVYTPVGLSDLKRVEQGPLSGQASILANSSIVTLPGLKTAGTFVVGRKYLISAIGSTDFTAVGGVNTVGKTFTATGAGSGSGTAYEAESAGLYTDYFKYLVGMQIDSTTLGSNQFLNTSGIYAFNLLAVDLTTPAPFQTSANLSIQLDNYFPTSNGMNSVANITGTSFAIQGQVSDVGVGSGTVAGVSKVVAYFTRGSNVLNLHGGVTSTGTTLLVKNDAVGALTSVIYPPTESGNRDYSFNVSSYSETAGNDADTANGGNNDGFEDKLTYNGSAVDWYAKFDSTQLADGPATLHYVIIDTAGNASHYTQSIFIANNPPTILQITLGTDLNGDGTIGNVASGESVAYNPSQFANTGFTVRGNSMNLTISASGGNGTMYYSVKYGATEKNGTLTSNSVNITDFTGISDSAVANDRSFTVFLYDSTPGTTPGVDSLSTTKTISMTIKNTDTSVPTVTMVPLYWNSASDNSLYGNSLTNGHLNFGTLAAPLNDTNPKVSGQIKFSGTLADDQRIQYVTMTIGNSTTGYDFGGGTSYGSSFIVAQWNSVSKTLVGVDNWATRGWKFVVSSESMTSAGHSANWELDWDTSKLNTIAGTGVSVVITAQDYRNPGSLGMANLSTPANQTIDVVPYITSVTTLLSNLNTQNTSVFNRTALGKYPVNASETIKLNGFNLTGATITGISSGITITSGVVSVPMTSASSGNLPLLVNSVPLINNLDNNSLDFNKMPNSVNNNLLTNDVALDVWQFNNRAAVPISGQISSPVMKINPVSGKMGFAFTNGPLYFSMGGTVGGTEYSYNYWQASYDFLTSVAFAYDSAGHTYGSAAGGDINSNSADKFSFMTDRWGKSGLDQNGSYGGTNALRLESIGQVNGGVNDFNKYRIKSPSYATSRIATAANSTNVYLAYYDDMNTEIRFRYGNLLDTATAKTNFSNLAAVNAGTFVVGTSYVITTVGTTNFVNIGAASNTVGVSFVATGAGTGSGTATAEANFYDSDTAGAPGVYSTAYKSIVAGSATGRNAGEYVSIGVIPGATVSTDVVVMVWYDATNQSLWYSYNTTPTINRSRTATAAGWSTPMQIFTNAGQYCQIAVDAGGGIHIAAYDNVNASLLYAHLASYSAASAETCVVDSYGIVGTDITLDVAQVGTKYLPYIGYYAQSSIKPKYAYLVDTSTTAPNGAVNDSFTGAWEVTLLPTSSSVPQDQINVGVWKDSTGVLKNSVTGTSVYTKTGSGYTATNYGQCFGNGTSNGVLAYQIKESTNGYIETAQKK